MRMQAGRHASCPWRVPNQGKNQRKMLEAGHFGDRKRPQGAALPTAGAARRLEPRSRWNRIALRRRRIIFTRFRAGARQAHSKNAPPVSGLASRTPTRSAGALKPDL